MKSSTKVKIAITVVWLFFGVLLMFGLSYEPQTLGETPVTELPMSIIEANKLDPNTIIKPGREWHENFSAFLLFMIPMAIMWLWTAFKKDNLDKPVKRRSRMM